MRIYRFTLPLLNNKGQDMSAAISAFKSKALELAGGYTQQPEVCGAWKGEGMTYIDHAAVLEVACETEAYKALLLQVIQLWPDQESFYVADVGQAHFVVPDRSSQAYGDMLAGGGIETAQATAA